MPDAASLFERHYPLIVRYLSRRVYHGDQAIVEDLAMEAFAKATAALDRYEDRGVPETAWLCRIAHNVLVDHYRVRAGSKGDGRNVSLDFLTSKVETIPAPVRPESPIDFEPYLARLTPMQRAVIECRFLESLTTRETSAVLGNTEDAVKKLQARALVQLRRMLEAEEVGVQIDMERWLRPSEVARRLGISQARVAQIRVDGRFETLETPLGHLIDAESVERYRQGRDAWRARRERVA